MNRRKEGKRRGKKGKEEAKEGSKRKGGKEEGKGREGRREEGKGERRGKEGRKGMQFPGEPDALQDPWLPSPSGPLPAGRGWGRPPHGRSGTAGPGGCAGLRAGPRCLAGQMVSFPPVRARFQPHAVILFFWNETGVASQRGPIRTKRKSCE